MGPGSWEHGSQLPRWVALQGQVPTDRGSHLAHLLKSLFPREVSCQGCEDTQTALRRGGHSGSPLSPLLTASHAREPLWGWVFPFRQTFGCTLPRDPEPDPPSSAMSSVLTHRNCGQKTRVDIFPKKI